MNRKQHFIWVSLFFTFFLTQVTLEAQEPVILDSKMKPGISNDMRIEELKVRWKKAALENCPGVPCVTVTVPGSPTGVSATAGNAQATVSFTAPSSIGGSGITGYTVTSNPGGITGTGSGSPITVTGLTNGTSYTFTVVAINAVGNSLASAASTAVTPQLPAFVCGTVVTDIDGNQYNTELIGTQCWFKENLKVTKYNDGTAIPLDATQTSPTDGTSLTWQNWDVGRYTIYDNQASNGTNATNYGFMYNWYAAAGIITSGGAPTKNICPSGWKVPTHGQWIILEQLLGGPNSAGIALKSTSILWSFLTNANNTSDFTALPGGRRLADGRFINVGTDAYLWSFPDIGSNVSWMRNLYTSDPDFYSYNNYNKSVGASIRCLKD
jgi:uncharacterized protein (TIGR02145 family)